MADSAAAIAVRVASSATTTAAVRIRISCTPWLGANAQADKDFFQRNGYCSDPLEADGGIDPGIPCNVDSGTD